MIKSSNCHLPPEIVSSPGTNLVDLVTFLGYMIERKRAKVIVAQQSFRGAFDSFPAKLLRVESRVAQIRRRLEQRTVSFEHPCRCYLVPLEFVQKFRCSNGGAIFLRLREDLVSIRPVSLQPLSRWELFVNFEFHGIARRRVEGELPTSLKLCARPSGLGRNTLRAVVRVVARCWFDLDQAFGLLVNVRRSAFLFRNRPYFESVPLRRLAVHRVVGLEEKASGFKHMRRFDRLVIDKVAPKHRFTRKGTFWKRNGGVIGMAFHRTHPDHIRQRFVETSIRRLKVNRVVSKVQLIRLACARIRGLVESSEVLSMNGGSLKGFARRTIGLFSGHGIRSAAGRSPVRLEIVLFRGNIVDFRRRFSHCSRLEIGRDPRWGAFEVFVVFMVFGDRLKSMRVGYERFWFLLFRCFNFVR